MQKGKNLTYIIFFMFISYICTLTSFNILLPDKAFSETENRVLQKAPSFSWDALLEGDLMADYEKYFADQFPGRDFWIGVKSDVERFWGKKENNGVYLGEDGYLLQEFSQPDPEELEKKLNVFHNFATSLPEVKKSLMLVPNAVKILEDQLPKYAPVDDEREFMTNVQQRLTKDITYVDVYDTLYGKREEEIFYKTDHHWTTRGAFYAYQKLGEYLNFTPDKKEFFQVKKVTDNFYGSLYSQGGFRHVQPDTIELFLPQQEVEYKVNYYDYKQTSNSLYFWENLQKKDKYTVFLGGNQSLIKVETGVTNGKKLAVVKDSYAHCFVPFLLRHYQEIYVIDLRYYNDSLQKLLQEQEIKEVLFLYNVKTFAEDVSLLKINKQ